MLHQAIEGNYGCPGKCGPGDQLPTRADGPSGLLSARGDTSSKPPTLSVSQPLPLHRRTHFLHSEKRRSPRFKPSRTSNLPPLTSVLPPSETNLSHLPSPAPSSQQREPQPCLPGPLSLCARADTCAGAVPVAPGGARGKGRALGGMRDSKGTGISDVSRQDNTINNQSIPTKSLSA